MSHPLPLTVMNGMGAIVTFNGAIITIERKGLLERLSVGKGSKRIPITAVTAVQWKPPGLMINGFIQFTIGGRVERRSEFGKQTRGAAGDENSVVFDRRRQPQFEALRDAVEAAMAAPTRNSATAPDVVDQLRRLAELRDTDMVSEREFETAKARLTVSRRQRNGDSETSPADDR